ncbi:acyl-CoA dehydrogenase family protein [Chelativorans sp. AA-79]|uniref:acyl-CoA dehydrogenase family protein n=1 Tax=Chelativorans sp. AA-79 TaxID=3028735 RepID=UPI0023F8CC1C|nr:acyl-CoA dehydrogenase family protein [Chelativorans sp. AA-79]WEX12442.1 acyl-CoA dehydrogenase family protein [Chelativorans sp. AA-79]
MLQDLVRKFVTSELIPLEKKVQEREASRGLGNDPVIPPDDYSRLLGRAQELGLWGMDVPEEFGGSGLGIVAKMVAVEEMSRSITPFRLPPESPNLWLLSKTCTPQQREKYLLPYARGDKRSSLALTEADAGSDVGAMRTNAKRVDGGWLLNGTKMWISWANVADFFIVVAVTDKEKGTRGGMTSFLVDADTPGFRVGNFIPTMGEPTPYELQLENVFIPDEQVLGEIGYAFKPLTNRLGVRRVEIAARCVGMANRLIDLMVTQAENRVTFGKPLADRQAVQWMIADSAIEVHAARLMVRDAAEKLDAGISDIREEASITKVYATEMISRVVDRAMQVYGGIGFSKETPIEYIYRNSRVLRILEGASEIHRMQIARKRLGE